MNFVALALLEASSGDDENAFWILAGMCDFLDLEVRAPTTAQAALNAQRVSGGGERGLLWTLASVYKTVLNTHNFIYTPLDCGFPSSDKEKTVEMYHTLASAGNIYCTVLMVPVRTVVVNIER